MYVEYLPGKKHPGREPEISDNLDSFTDAGYQLEDTDLVVDIDSLNHEQIQNMISMFRINTQVVWTGRGAHLYFKKPEGFRGAQGICALGVKVEYKHKGNTRSVTVKLDGVARKVERQGIREELPDFLKSNRKKYEELQGLAEGDGRNNKLFQHRRKMGNIKDWPLVFEYINRYILDTPLPDKEMETLTRDMQITAGKDGESAIADMIMDEKRVVKFQGHLYFYNGKEYISDSDELSRTVYRYCQGQKTTYVLEVIKQMELRAPLIPTDKPFDIKFNNGILRAGKFIEVDYTDFTPYSLDIDYDPDAEPVPYVDDYLDQLTNNDPDYRQRLLEILGYCLVTDKEFKRLLAKFFIFVGDGGNGKGTLLMIIKSILNSKNVSGLTINNFTDERYVNQLIGKLANLGDDIHDQPIDNKQMKMLKNISTCDAIEIRRLYENSKTVEITATLIFTSNHILKTFEKGESYKRRVDWLPMYTKPTKKDPKFISKATSKKALRYWARLMVEGYMRLYQNEAFTYSKLVADFNESYHEENNTAVQYLRDLNPEVEIDGMRSPELYAPYELWCDENGLTAQSKKLFTQTVYELYGYQLKLVKVNGKPQRVYTLSSAGGQKGKGK